MNLLLCSILSLLCSQQIRVVSYTTIPIHFGTRKHTTPIPNIIKICNQERIKYDQSSVLKISNDIEQSSNDGEALQSLFSNYCDSQGLLTKDNLRKIPSIAQLLQDEDLLEDELDEIWESAPKFPILNDASSTECIDVDSFIQIYRDIDDLFEDDEDEITTNDTESNENANSEDVIANTKEETIIDPIQEKQEHELTLTFQSLSKNTSLISKEILRQWDEIDMLMKEDMLTEEEFDLLWERTTKSPGSSDMIDVDGFLSLNVALDDLFEDEEEMDDDDELGEEEDDSLDDEIDELKTDETAIITANDMPPSILFTKLSNSDNLVGMDELKRWGDLQDMIQVGDLLPLELESIFETIPKAVGNYLDEAGFVAFYNAIDDLFENDDDDGEEAKTTEPASVKPKLMEVLYEINQIEESDDENDYLPCGLSSTDEEIAMINTLVSQLEKEPSNKVTLSKGMISPDDLVGSWNLLYTTSPMMKFNKGLSGLGGSFPNGKYAGLIQKLQASFFMDVEYTERISVSSPPSASFDVTITGDWELKNSVSLLTGEPSIVLDVVPNKVIYGPTNTRADHWKSVRAMNLLNVVYLDGDVRVMRGNMNNDVLFIFQRV